MKLRFTRGTVVEVWLIFLVILNLGFGKMTGNRYLSSNNSIISITAMSSLVLFFLSYDLAYRESKGKVKSLNSYIGLVILLWFVEVIFTLIINGNQFVKYSWFLNSTRFFELFLVYPLYYVFNSRNGKRFINLCIALLIANLMIRQLSWYLYNFQHTTIFYDLLFEIENWSRNGIYRCSGTSVTLFFYIYLCVQFCRENRYKYVYLACIIYIMQYTILVFASRVEFLFEVFLLFYMLEFQPNRNKRILGFKMLIFVVACVIITTTPIVDIAFSLINLNSKNIYSSSLTSRINTVRQCIRIIFDYPITGVGFDFTRFSAKYPGTIFSDVGVIGCIANLGILGFTASVGYLVLVAKESRNHYDKYDHLMCTGILLNIVIIGGVLSSSFVYQKIFSVPFVIGFLMYIKCNNQKKVEKQNELLM